MSIERYVYWGTATCKEWEVYLVATDSGLGLITWPNESFEAVKNWVKRFLPGHKLVHKPDRTEPYSQALLHYLQYGITEPDAFLFDLHGTNFQIHVWNTLRKIESGTTKTYSEIANMVGRANAVRAVAHAISANPIAFLIPCHRVIGKDGSLRGYRGGLRMKEALLYREGAFSKEPG